MKAKKKQVVGLLINLLEWAIVSVLCGSFISHPICVLLGAGNILFCQFRRWRSARKGVPEV